MRLFEMQKIKIQKNLLYVGCLVLPLFSSSSHAIDPLFTKSAQIFSDITLDSVISYYKGRELEELKDFDAYEVQFDLIAPVSNNMQVRLTWPAYTNGSGTVNDPRSAYHNTSTDVSGNNGTYEFLSLGLEYQFKHLKQAGYNLLAYGNIGARTAYLDTSHGDKLNHKGNLAKFGLRYENKISHNSNLLTNVEYRYYWDSDDINPDDDNSTSFNLVNISGAWIWNKNKALSPVVELTYSTNVKQYHAVTIIPEVVYTLNSTIDLKLGLPIGLTADADDYGVRAGLSVHF